MTDRALERKSWFWPPEPEAVRRAVWVGVVWAYVAGLAAATMMLIGAGAALAVQGIVYLADFGNRSFDVSEVATPVSVVFWIVAPAALAVAVWSAAYASTTEQSVLRGLAGVGAGGILALLFHLSGFSGAALVGLGVGWGLAIPVEHPARWAARAVLPVVIGALAFPVWDGVALPIVILILVISPAVAGLFVWLADIAYQGLVSLRHRTDGGTVGRAPTSVD